MKPADRLRELDRAYLPQAAERTRQLAAQAAAQRARLAGHRQRLTATTPAQLDERFAGNRLLQLVRDIPQVGFVIIAAVFLAGTATALVGRQPVPEPPPAAQAPDQPGTSNRLGPDIGQTTVSYEAVSLQDLEQLAAGSPDASRLALISFADYQTPAQVQALLAGFQVRRVYLRARVGGPDAAQLPYDIRGELGPALRRAYADVALSRLAVRRSYLAYVATTTDDPAYHSDYAAYAASTGREVIAYQHSCACVFGVIVQASARHLLALRGQPQVRAVQVAAAGAQLGVLLVEPLLPETKGIVTRGPVTEAP